MSTHVTKENLQEFATKLHAKNKTLFALKSQTGTPSVVTTAASMTDQTKIYVYMGTETGYIKGGWYYYSGSAWTFGGMYNSGDWIGDDLKQALLQLASKVAYIDDDGQDYYDALESALYHDATLVSISAAYTQSGTVYDTDSLDSLKADLVVTATHSDSSTETVTAYTLSGALEVGTSTITVAYGGKTTTFDVTVTERPHVLENGTHTFSDGSTVTVDYDHVTIVLGTKSGQKFVNLSSLSNNTTDIGSTNNINNQTTEFLSISNGETVTASIFNASSDNANWKTANDSSVEVTINLRKKSATTSIMSTPPRTYPKEYTDSTHHYYVKTNSTETWTASDNVIAGCLFVFIGSNFPSGTTIEFDVAISVA